MSPKWFRRVKNCFIAVSWATVSGARLVNPRPRTARFYRFVSIIYNRTGGALSGRTEAAGASR